MIAFYVSLYLCLFVGTYIFLCNVIMNNEYILKHPVEKYNWVCFMCGAIWPVFWLIVLFLGLTGRKFKD